MELPKASQLEEDYQSAKWLDADEAKRYLRFKNVGTIRNLVSSGRLPRRKPFGKLLFKRAELDLFIERSRKD